MPHLILVAAIELSEDGLSWGTYPGDANVKGRQQILSSRAVSS